VQLPAFPKNSFFSSFNPFLIISALHLTCSLTLFLSPRVSVHWMLQQLLLRSFVHHGMVQAPKHFMNASPSTQRSNAYSYNGPYRIFLPYDAWSNSYVCLVPERDPLFTVKGSTIGETPLIVCQGYQQTSWHFVHMSRRSTSYNMQVTVLLNSSEALTISVHCVIL